MKGHYDPAFQVNEELAHELLGLTDEERAGPPPVAAEASAPEPAAYAETPEALDAIVSHIEVNNRHGVGVLLERLFRRYPNILSIRSQNHFGGRQEFGAHDCQIAYEDAAPSAVRRKVEAALPGRAVARILSVPYYADDVRTALALHEITGAPLATYLMDDQNVFASGIPDALMAELLERSRLRLAISTELAACYEIKYGLKLWLMPPVAPARLLHTDPRPARDAIENRTSGAILGNIWGQRWLDLLRETVRGSGITLRWYSTNYLRYLQGSPEELARDGIEIPPGPPLPDDSLVAALRRTAFVVVPTGDLDERDDRRFIARLSLPSRIPFILATTHTPFLVIGDETTGAARFVKETGVGLVCAYEREAFQRAADEITRPGVNLAFRRRALALAGRFNDAGAAEWIWQSLERGEPFDSRYEDLMRKPRPEVEALVRSMIARGGGAQ